MASAVEFRNGFPTVESARAAQAEQDLRRALEAYRFFYPTVSLEGIFQGTREAGAKDNETALLFVARPRHMGFTLNSDTPYSGGILDLRASGPMVIELPAYIFTDWTEQPIDCTCLRWEDNLEFWRVLHGVIDAEPAIEEMRPMLGALAELGIEAGRPFAPDEATARLLTEAARLGRDEMLVSAFASRRPDRTVWSDRSWEWVGLRPENGTFEREGSLDVEAKDRWFAQAIVASPAMFRRAVGQGSLYWLAHRDQEGQYLDGGRSYRLTVPLPVPASLFWSVTCYDAQTRSEVVADQGQAALRSLFEDLTPDGADHVDLYFGPSEPAEANGRWIQTAPGRGWFAYFRIYGPGQPAFDASWRPGDLTLLP